MSVPNATNFTEAFRSTVLAQYFNRLVTESEVEEQRVLQVVESSPVAAGVASRIWASNFGVNA